VNDALINVSNNVITVKLYSGYELYYPKVKNTFVLRFSHHFKNGLLLSNL
jgi:hypothetical protein